MGGQVELRAPPPGDPHPYSVFVLLGLSSPPLILDVLRVAFSVRAERKDAAGTKRRFLGRAKGPPQKKEPEVSCGHFRAPRTSDILQTKVAKSAGRQAPVENLGALSRLLWGSGPRAKQNTAKKGEFSRLRPAIRRFLVGSPSYFKKPLRAYQRAPTRAHPFACLAAT